MLGKASCIESSEDETEGEGNRGYLIAAGRTTEYGTFSKKKSLKCGATT